MEAKRTQNAGRRLWWWQFKGSKRNIGYEERSEICYATMKAIALFPPSLASGVPWWMDPKCSMNINNHGRGYMCLNKFNLKILMFGFKF